MNKNSFNSFKKMNLINSSIRKKNANTSYDNVVKNKNKLVNNLDKLDIKNKINKEKNLKKISLLSSNYTIEFAKKIASFFNSINIETTLFINEKIELQLIKTISTNQNTYLFLLGINHIKNINKINLSDLIIKKTIIYQIEQLNQDSFYFNNL